MASVQKTKNSLILRLRNRQDADAWREFVAIYQPVILRIAKRKGLQQSDAAELAQRVFLALVRAIDRFQPDTQKGKFRSWLYRICHNELCNQFAANQKHQASGDSTIQQLLDNHPEQSDISSEFNIEYRRSLFRYAAAIVQPHVSETSWQAFYQTAVQHRPIADVAQELAISVGAVYIARSRIMAKLQAAVRQYQEQHDEL